MRLSEWRAIVRLNNRLVAVEGGEIVARKQRIAVVALAPARFQEAHNFYYPPQAESSTNFGVPVRYRWYRSQALRAMQALSRS
jgi:hypothetical protein